MSSSKIPERYSLLTVNNVTKDVTVFVGLVVSGILDSELLARKASELISLWPILGGELVTKTVPYSFTTGSIVDFKSRHIDKALSEVLPFNIAVDDTDFDRPSYRAFDNHDSGDSLFHFESIRALNPPVKNLFALRVTVLKDTTLLGFRVPHHLCDGQSAYDVVRSYCRLIAGEAPPQLVFPPDTEVPLSKLVQFAGSFPENNPDQDDRFVNPSDNFALGTAPVLKYIGHTFLQSAKAMIGLSEGHEERYIHLPNGLVQEWRRSCQEELEEAVAQGKLEAAAGVELSKNDVITAWFLKCAFAHTTPDEGPVDFMYNFNYRSALEAPEPGTLYLHNSFYNIRTHWPSLREFQEASLASISLAIRLSVLRNRQPWAIHRSLKYWEQNINEAVVFGSPGTRLDFLPILSPWTTFEYNGMDFTEALAQKSQRDEVQGKVIFTHPYVALPMSIAVKPFAIVLKDGHGGYWLRSTLLSSGWKAHEI